MFLAVTVLFGLLFDVSRGQADERVPVEALPVQSLVSSATAITQTPISSRTFGGAINGSPKANCTCRYKGQDVFFGQSICMKTGNGLVQARCTRYLNNTSWQITQVPCPVS